MYMMQISKLSFSNESGTEHLLLGASIMPATMSLIASIIPATKGRCDSIKPATRSRYDVGFDEYVVRFIRSVFGQ